MIFSDIRKAVTSMNDVYRRGSVTFMLAHVTEKLLLLSARQTRSEGIAMTTGPGFFVK